MIQHSETDFRSGTTGAATVRIPNPMIALVWLSIFLPGHLFDTWVDRLFSGAVAVFSAIILFVMPANTDARHNSRQAALLLTFIQFLYIFSFVHAVAFMGIETGLRDYFETFRYLILLLFVLYAMRHYDDRVRRTTELAMAAVLYYSLFVGLCYMRYVPGFSEFFRYKLYAETKTAVTWYGDLRLAAPFENPNFYGFVIVEVLAYMAFFSRSRLRLTHAAAALLALYCSGSRTAWVGGFIVCGAAVVLYTYRAMKSIAVKRLLQVSLPVLLAVAAGVRFSGDIMKNHRVQALLMAQHAGGVHTEVDAAGRIEQDLQVIEFIKRSPVLGWGPSKYATWTYVDNQYLSWGLRNGLLGGFFLLIASLILAKRFIFSLRRDLVTLVGASAFVLAIAVQNLAAENLNNFRLFFITWFIGTAMARRAK